MAEIIDHTIEVNAALSEKPFNLSLAASNPCRDLDEGPLASSAGFTVSGGAC